MAIRYLLTKYFPSSIKPFFIQHKFSLDLPKILATTRYSSFVRLCLKLPDSFVCLAPRVRGYLSFDHSGGINYAIVLWLKWRLVRIS